MVKSLGCGLWSRRMLLVLGWFVGVFLGWRQGGWMWYYGADLLYDIVLDYVFKHQVNTVPRRAQLERTFILNLQQVTALENSTLCNTTGAGCKTILFSIRSSIFYFFLLLFHHFGNSWQWSESKITKVRQSSWWEMKAMFSQIFRAVFPFSF